MRNIFLLIKKNLKLLIRSKGSALIVVFAPLMLILLIGLSYSTSQTGLNIGVYSPAFTEEIDTFLASLQEEGYKITKYDSSEKCIEDIKLSFIHTCLALPENFQVQENSPKEITFYIDQTKINLVYLITDTLNKKFNLKSKEISQELASQLLTKLSSTQTKLAEKSGQLDATKSKNQQAITQSDTIKSELVALDFALPTAEYNISGTLEAFQSNTSSKISQGLSLLASAKSAVSSSTLNSSEKSLITADLDDAKAKFSQLSDAVNGTGTATLGEISSLLSSLQADFNLVKTKLASASEKVSSAGDQLSSISSTLNEGISSLDALKTALTEIQQDLASQKVTDAATIAAPLAVKIEKITAEKTHLNYLFPSLMILVVMFISLLLGTTLVMMEKHNQAYFRNFIIPVRKITFVFATYLTNCFLVLIQITIILGLSLLFLEDILAQLPLTTLILFVSASVFTLMGMLIGYLFTSEDTGALASISFGALLLFVSGVILPLESMPHSIRQITYFNPFVLGEKLIREIFIFKTDFSVIFNDLLLLIGYALVLFIVILIVDSLGSKHFVTKLRYKHHKRLRQKRKK